MTSRTLVPTVAVVLLLAVAPAMAQTVAFTGADLHTVSDGVIEDGVLVVRDGEIVALGDGSTEIPDGADTVDVSGKRIYPGFLQAYSDLGLAEIDSVRGSVDVGEMGENNADIRAEVAVSADNIRLLPAIGGGLTHAHVVPRGGTFTGTSAVMRLDGWTWEEMVVEAPAGLHLNFPSVPSGGDGEVVETEEMKALGRMLEDATRYGDARAAGATLGFDRKLERIWAALQGELRLILHADTADQLEQALPWAEEMGFEDIVLITTTDASYLAKEIAEKGIPVILETVLGIPGRDHEPYDWNFAAPARLAEAGVTFALAGQGDSAFARNLPIIAGMTRGHGLDAEVALRSVTLTAAEVLGVDDRLGSLEEGKEASFFVADGDPLEIVTSIERVWIRGEEVDLDRDRQRQLWKRYRDRPESR